MIFGFNTDVRHDATVYHVQTEVRERESVLESQVFVAGRCIGKVTRPLAPDADAQELARTQHRDMVEGARAGTVQSMLDKPETDPLTIELVAREYAVPGTGEPLAIAVSQGSAPVAGALVTLRLELASDERYYGQGVSDGDGVALVAVQAAELGDHDVSVLVQATFGGRSATRKFRLRRQNREK